MWWQECFEWLEVYCQVEHYVGSLEVGLGEWKFNIKL
jgi:hypothetical protein